MPPQTDNADTTLDDGQRRALLEALADDTLAPIVGVLLRGPATQSQMTAATGIERTLLSRSLKYLRAIGLVRSGRGRDAQHAVVRRAEVFAVLKAADLLARAVNDVRAAAQTSTAKRTLGDELRGPRDSDEPRADDGTGGPW